MRGVRQRFSAYSTLVERTALPALHTYLRDKTDVTADQAAKILVAAKNDLQALPIVSNVDPEEAYLRRKIAARALGLEGYSLE